MQRRHAITLLGGAVVWPLAGRAQWASPVRRIGVLTGFAQGDTVGESLLATFRQQLAASGWMEGRNIDFKIRWGGAKGLDRLRTLAAELVRMNPEVIVVHGPNTLTAVRRETDQIPIIFASLADPIAAGHVSSLARPGGNVTGFTNYSGMPSPKLLEALKEVAPNVTRVAFVITPANPAMARQLSAMESVAPSFAVKVTSILPRDPGGIAPAIAAFAQEPNGGLVVSSDVFMITHRDLIIAAAARCRLPAVYHDRSFVTAGGLMSYSADRRDSYRGVARYVDLILRGAKPGDLPVQQPGKFEFLLNLKTAQALGLEITRLLLARADEVIE